MPWTLTDDVELYAERVWSLLAQRPVLHTLPLTVIETLRTGHRWSADPVVCGWYTAGSPDDPRPVPVDGPVPVNVPVPVIVPVPVNEPVSGAVSMTPPFELLLPEVPPGTIDDLISMLREASVHVPGVRGGPSQVADFSARWRSGTAIVEAGGERQRLYRLHELTPPSGVDGRARRATVDDVEAVTEFWDEFQSEAGIRRANAGLLVRARIDEGLVWLWDGDGQVVSMAARNAVAVGVARVGPVYTPPGHRRRGYAAAVTSACSQDAFSDGARDVVLFTDLDNPTSNSVYQSIGYRPVTDFETILFG